MHLCQMWSILRTVATKTTATAQAPASSLDRLFLPLALSLERHLREPGVAVLARTCVLQVCMSPTALRTVINDAFVG